jgi:hypothetical protein
MLKGGRMTIPKGRKMRKAVMFMSLVVGFVALTLMPTAPVKAQKGTGAQSGTYVCKSGHRARNPKACKENGGHL